MESRVWIHRWSQSFGLEVELALVAVYWSASVAVLVAKLSLTF